MVEQFALLSSLEPCSNATYLRGVTTCLLDKVLTKVLVFQFASYGYIVTITTQVYHALTGKPIWADVPDPRNC